MKMGILVVLLIYYAGLTIYFFTAPAPTTDFSSTGNPINASGLDSSEVDSGGLFSIGVSFARFFSFVAFGLNIPVAVPALLAFMFFIWQSCVTVFTVGFVISSIWNG